MAKKNFLTIILILIFLFISLPSVLGEVTGSEYSVASSALSIQGANISGDDYESRIYLGANAGGDAQGAVYLANIGFLNKSGTSTAISYTVTVNGTEIVQAGNVYSVTIEVVNLSGEVSISSAPKITLYDPLENLIVSGADATLISDKKYQYNFTTSPTHTAGAWETDISIGINSVTKQYGHNWTLSNGYTETSINSVNVASAPVINANVTITHEGGLSYEYPYEYCIVSVLTQQCGNSENVAYGSGYKLLSPGQSWNSILSLNIAQSGNYWFKIIVHYGTQNSGATKSFSASYTPAVKTGETESTTGSSSTTNQPTTIDVQGSATVSKQQITNGIIAKIETAEEIIINLEISASEKIETHTIKVSNIGINNVTLVISSNPIILQLIVGDEKKVDIDGDGKTDIYFKLNKIENGKADLLIKQVSKSSSITGKTIEYPKHLMDVATRILDEYKIINPGGKVIMEVTLYNLGTEEIKDAIIRYCIETTDKEIIKCNEETIAIYTKIQLVKEFLISQDTKPGEYFIKTETIYANQTAQSETSFEVKRGLFDVSDNSWTNYLFLIGLGIIILILLIVIILIYKNKKRKLKITSLKAKLRQLNELKTKGAISEKLYKFEKEKLLRKFGRIFVSLFFVGIIIILIILISNKKITGIIIENIDLSTNKKPVIFGISILAVIALFLILRKKIFSYFKSLGKFINYLWNKHKKYPSNSIFGLINKKVYSDSGHYIGEICEIILEKNRIKELKVKTDKKYKIKAKGIIVNYKHVKNVGEIIIIDEKIYEKLND